MSARATALEALIACRIRNAWANAALKEYLFRDRLDSRDAALATRLCYGVIQNRLLLDHYLKQLLSGKIKDLQPILRDILHLGLYQIYEMDRIPASAAVNESVQLARRFCKNKNAPGLVNGVLRNAVRTKGTLDPPKSWEQRFSHPQPLLDLLLDSLEKPLMEPMLRANNDCPRTLIQANTRKLSGEELKTELEQEGVKAEAHPWMENCLVLSETGSLEGLSAFQKGLFYVQDPAAKLAVLCAGLESLENPQVLDCCAAPGGKSFAAAMATAGKGSILSCDRYPHKIDLISKGAQRLGLASITALCHDALEESQQWVDRFDAVIADVPCSGLGIIRKKPDIRYKNLEEMEALPPLQLRILRQQARYVKPGGLLLYATCTLLRRENQEVVEAFLRDHPNFTTEPLPLPGVFPPNESGMLTLVPGQYDTDGFFICRLRRKP